jgi:hypothetical protein
MTTKDGGTITPAIRRTIRAEIRKALGEVPLEVIEAQQAEIERRHQDPHPGRGPVEPTDMTEH